MGRIKTPNCNDFEAVQKFIDDNKLPKLKPAKFIFAITKMDMNPEGDVIHTDRLPILKKTMQSLR